MLRDDFRPPLVKKNEFFYTRGRCFQNSNSTKCLSAFYIIKKKQSEVDFWFSSYCHFSDIIYKTPSSGQNVISLFFNN